MRKKFLQVNRTSVSCDTPSSSSTLRMEDLKERQSRTHEKMLEEMVAKIFLNLMETKSVGLRSSRNIKHKRLYHGAS